ncbi:MAG: lysylphosphatidylglycerol synthase domain-containing protein [Woeseiaceae bacterium]|jgi:glycosyltransferase 2 family protein
MQRKRVLVRIFSIALVLIGCGFIYYLLEKDWAMFVRSVTEVDKALFGVSVVLGLLANLMAAHFYVFLLRGHHGPVSWQPLCRIFLLSQLVRYVPGKVWSYLYQMGALPAGISKTTIVLTNVEMSLISMLVISGASLAAFFWPGAVLLLCVVLGLATLISLAYRSGALDRVLNRLAFALDRLGVKHLARRPYDQAHMITIITSWVVLVFVALIVALQAIWPLSTSESIFYAACLGLSWIVSALVFFVPVGIGVRETGFVALGLIAGGVLDGGQLATTAIILRFWQLSVDVLSGACGIIVDHNRE